MKDKILELVSKYDYRKGLEYDGNISFYKKYSGNNFDVVEFHATSQRNKLIKYLVTIVIKDNEVIDSSCNCPQYRLASSCKHLAAVLINKYDDIFNNKPSINYSDNLIDYYYNLNKNKNKIKKQVKLEVNIDSLKSYDYVYANIKLFIGIDKMYCLNSKLHRLFDIFKYQEGKLVFGKYFTFDYDENYFLEEDLKILNYLKYLADKSRYYYNFNYLNLYGSELDEFLLLFKDKDLVINNIKLHGFIYGNPFNIKLDKKDNYELSVDTKNSSSIATDSCFILSNKLLYKIDFNILDMISRMQDLSLKKLVFDDTKLEAFTKGILPFIKDDVKLDDSLSDKIIINFKPKIKLYIDYYYNCLVCNIKLLYKNKEIDYFSNDDGIVRDLFCEQEVVDDLLKYNFKLINNRFIIDNDDDIGEFLYNYLSLLVAKYEVYTSKKVDDTKIVKSNIRSSFSIGKDNILSYKFDYDNIDSTEILDVLNSLEQKKKYYRLKNGNIINLLEDDELNQLNDLTSDMQLSNKDLVRQEGTIPKYRAIYLDSLKNDKYTIIDTNNLFRDLINKFNTYKDVNLDFSKDNVLRDYQKVGVKWLYNIYKCGFGSILADEMGLGKSIQLIYFIKEILKEKKDAKILIVAPTSLIYNWKNEFDKFASDLSYKVFSENRKKREDDLHEIDDINILITTYGLIRQDIDIYCNISFELMAIDEAQNIKNINTQVTKCIKLINANTKVALTGTPIENSVSELWSIFDFIMPGYLANLKVFNQKYNTIEKDKLLNLEKQIKPFILRRKKKDVILELPDKIENNIYIDLNKEQMALYVTEVEKTKKEIDQIIKTEGFKAARFKILQLLTKLREICIDPHIIYENYPKESSKIEQLIKLVEEIVANNHKILIFTSFKTALDIVDKKLRENNISTYIIDGSVSSKKRMDLVSKFNADDTNVFLITLKAGGTGLNLTAADVVIHLDLWWNPQAENQATDRAHRIGQVNTVEVIKLICKGTIEQRILELQDKKKKLASLLLDSENQDKNIISSLTEKDIKNLLQLDNQ